MTALLIWPPLSQARSWPKLSATSMSLTAQLPVPPILMILSRRRQYLKLRPIHKTHLYCLVSTARGVDGALLATPTSTSSLLSWIPSVGPVLTSCITFAGYAKPTVVNMYSMQPTTRTMPKVKKLRAVPATPLTVGITSALVSACSRRI